VNDLILRKARGNRPGPPEWDPDDYDVIAEEGEVVGRIYRRSGVPDDREPWHWSIMVWGFSPGVTNGLAATREEAMAAFKKNWRAL
jgi:hypothetical protein